jgi:hypothetical protein
MNFSKWRVNRTVWRVSFLIGAVAGLITYGVMRMGIVYLITREHSSAKVEDANIFIIVSVLLVFLLGWAMARGHWRRGIKEKHPEIYNPWFFGILYYFKDPETKTKPIVWKKSPKELTFGDLQIKVEKFFTTFSIGAQMVYYQRQSIKANVDFSLDTGDITYLIRKYQDCRELQERLINFSTLALIDTTPKFYSIGIKSGMISRAQFGTDELFRQNFEEDFCGEVARRLKDDPFIRIDKAECIFASVRKK